MKLRMLILGSLVIAGTVSAAWLPTGYATTPTAPTSSIVSNSNAGAVIDVTLPGVVVTEKVNDGQAYAEISIPGDVLAALDVGKPEVPKLSYLLGIPDNARASVSVQILETRTFDDILCYPYQPPATDKDNFPFTIDREFYTRNVSYPELDCRVMNTGVWRDLSVANVQVYPVHYNPAARQLTVASRFRVFVNYSGGSYERKTVKSWMASIYVRFIDNFGQLDLNITDTDGPGVKYLVIAHDNWYNNPWLVDSLVGWHYKRGVETRLIHKSSWAAAEIRDSIKAEYQRNTPAELRWTLLVGEYSEIPCQALGGVGYGDYYYSDILPASPDNYPEIGLSRLSPASAMDLQQQIKKILKYEKNPPATANWLSKHALIACSELYPGKYSACIRGIYNEPMGFYRYNFDTLMCQFHGNDSIARIINEGRSVVTYRGHGAYDQWYTLALQGGAPWYIANVEALTNGDLTPMVYNIACECGAISNATCLSEKWLRKYPGGASGSFAATQASYTLPNHGICSTLVRAMCDTWTITVPGVRNYYNPTFDIGGIQDNVDAYVGKYWPGSPYPDNIYMYLNLGDPAMEVWSGGMPQTPTVDYPPTVPLGPYSLNVAVDNGSAPIRKALVCAWKPGEFYATGYTDPSGQAILNINAVTPGDFSVTVSTGHANASPPLPILPFEGICTAGGGSRPRVICVHPVIDDAAPGGNGDGIANPGETINLPAWFKNVGGAPASGVYARLRTTDPFTTITDSAKTLGTIPDGDSAYTGADGFNFAIAPQCTNAHRIDLVVNVRDANDSLWISHVYVTVGAPVLNYTTYTVDDPPPGGNNNHRLDPNETAYLITSVTNIGRGSAENAWAFLKSGDPRLVVNDSFGGFGTILPDSTRNNAGDQFQVTASPAIPPGTMLPCTLHLYAAGGYSATRPFIVIVGFLSPGATLLDHDTGYCKLSVTAYGALGYDQPADLGSGFCYPKAAASGLYYGGMLCGNSAAYMVDHYYGVPASSVQSDWVMQDSIRFYPPDAGDEMIRGAYTDAGHSAAQGLKTTQTSYQCAAPGYDDFVVLVFDYSNTGAAMINGLYSGIMCDFDIGTSTANDASTETVRRAAYMKQTSTANPTMGIKLLAPTTAANLSVIDHDVYVYPTDTAMNEGMKYRFLNGQLHFASSNRSYDWSVVVSAGPFSLPVGASSRVAYAIVGGTDVNSFLVNCDSAQSWYDGHVAILEPATSGPLRLNSSLLGLSPNPFARTLNVNYSAQEPGRLLIRAYDAAGREVAVIADQAVKPGAGQVHWQPANLANGIYFIKACLNGREMITKALLLK
jgi:hypothetical protein